MENWWKDSLGLINFQAVKSLDEEQLCACVLANLQNCVESWVWKLAQLHDRLEFHKNPASFAVCVSLLLLHANFHSTSFSPRFLSLYGAFHSRFYLIGSERDDGKYVLFTSGGSGIIRNILKGSYHISIQKKLKFWFDHRSIEIIDKIYLYRKTFL